MRRIKHPTDVGVVCEPKMSLLVTFGNLIQKGLIKRNEAVKTMKKERKNEHAKSLKGENYLYILG